MTDTARPFPPQVEIGAPCPSLLIGKAEQPGDGDVLVDIRPMDADPTTDEALVAPLLWCGRTEPRKPR